MKNALILHGTEGSPEDNWFSWLESQLKKVGYQVWVPRLPGSDRPNVRRYNQFLLQENTWNYNSESILIGHSSGAVAILGLLQALPDGVIVDHCYLVGAFKDNTGWDALNGLFEDPFDFDLIKKRAKKITFIHSDNDPYCPLDHAKYLSEKLSAELIVKKGQKHFSVETMGEAYKKFPMLLELIIKG